MKKFKIITLGCKCNQIESENFREELLELDLLETSENPDFIIINTCSVTKIAHQKSVALYRKSFKKHPKAFIAATGCAATLEPEIFAGFSGKVFSNEVKENLVFECLGKKVFPIRSGFKDHTRAFVKIQDGCDRFCSYCIVPFVRGRSTSRKEEDVLQEVACLTKKDFSEIVLTGINLGDYAIGLINLLKKIAKVPGVERIRLSSLEPEDITAELMDLLLSDEKFANSLHVSLQSGSNKILKLMGREPKIETFLDLAHEVNKKDKKFTFSADMIVGFPKESLEDFEKSVEVIKKVGFIKVHLFPFSPRPLTRAENMEGKVPKEIVDERKQILEKVCQEVAKKKKMQMVGSVEKILLENTKDKKYISGLTRNNLKVFLPREDFLKAGDFVQVELLELFLEKEAFLGRKYVV